MLGVGVTLLLVPQLGSDGYSTLVSGLSRATGVAFAVVNLAVGLVFVLIAWSRGVNPGVGTVVQVVVVGAVVSVGLEVVPSPEGLVARLAVMALAFPVLAVGIALYLGCRWGAGPIEAAALAYDPPLPFAWSYNAVQATGALVGWLLGAAIGPGTVLVVVLLGPTVALAARLLRQNLHQPGSRDAQEPATSR